MVPYIDAVTAKGINCILNKNRIKSTSRLTMGELDIYSMCAIERS